MDRMNQAEYNSFNEAIHLVTWKKAHEIIFDYLSENIETPVSKIIVSMTLSVQVEKISC